jgi:putative peptidoglycan lipid II flippase
VRRIHDRDVTALRRFTGAALGAITVVLLVAGVLAVLGVPLLLGAVTLHVEDPLVRRQHLHLGFELALMQMPQILLYGVIGAGIAVQQAHGRFAVAAAAPAIENIGIIAVMMTSALTYGAGVDVDAVHAGQIMLLGLGTTAAVALHAGLQWWGAYGLGVALVPRPDHWGETEVRALLRRGSSVVGYTGLYWTAFLSALVSAGSIPGGLVAFQMAANLCNFPVALTALPLASAQLPRLAGSHQRNQLAAFHSTYWTGLRLLTFVALPASIILAVIPLSLARAVAFGEMHSASGTVLLAACIGGLGIGVVGESVFTLVTSSCYACNDKSTPLQAMLLRLLVVATGVGIARSTLAGPQLLWTLGAAIAAGNVVAGAYLHAMLRRTLTSTNLSGAIGAAELVLAVVAVVPAILVANWLGSGDATNIEAVWVALIAVSASAATYLVLHFLRGSLELELVFPNIGRLPFFGQISSRRSPTGALQAASEAERPLSDS